MEQPDKLDRALGLSEATALNITFMVGIGPFVVIPLIIQAMNGPQSLIAWLVGALLALADGCVWAELGAAMPQAGGSYVFLREAYGPERWGRLISFLYIWQTIFQGPLSIASGALGFADYSTYLTSKSTPITHIMDSLGGSAQHIIAAAVVLLAVVLLYRRIRTVGGISIVLCILVLSTMLWLIYGGLGHFKTSLLIPPAGAWTFSWLFLAGLGHATVQSVYSYLGYYNVCNLGGEMQNPERNIPRAIFISILVIAILYFVMQTSILAVVPWQEAARAKAVVSLFVERTCGPAWATLATILILITAFGSVFSATLGYSRVPYAAAKDGNFLSVFARVHSKEHFPHVSLLALGAMAVVFSLSLGLRDAIRSILAMRCIIQFVGQSAGLILLRKRWGEARFPFRMWLYPLPVLTGIVGWTAIFVSTGARPVLAATAAAVVGILVYLVRARWLRHWPFEEAA